MKRKMMVVLLAAGIAAAAMAQGWGRGGWGGWGGQPPVLETVTVSGSLTIAQGSLAVKDGGTVYIVGGLHRFVGFIEGLKEGAEVKLEGRTAANSPDSTKFLMADKMTLNGKEYELTRPAPVGQMYPQMQMHHWQGQQAPSGRQRRRMY